MKQSRFLWGIVASSCLLIFPSCSKSSINKAMQEATVNLLTSEMKSAKIDSAVVLITSVSTGEVLVKTKLFYDFATGQISEASSKNFDNSFEPGLIVAPFTALAVMEEGGYTLMDDINSGDGSLFINERTIYDEAVWGKGGYGFVELSECITNPSKIGLVLFVEDAFKGKREAFMKRMEAMSFGAPAEQSPFASVNAYPAVLNAFSIGSSFKLSPTQLATAWNGLANGGKVMALTTSQGDTATLNASMIKPENRSSMNELLVNNSKRENSKSSNIAFYKSIYQVKNTYKQTITGSFCGYYPADKPQYSCVVVLFYSEAPDADAKSSRFDIDLSGKSIFYSLSTMKVQ